ncbi:MAG: exopolyphosphatase, partial [Acidimicrobiales bacterium]
AVAAVDCGTNSTRVLVAGPDGRPLTRLMRITRLGEGVDRTGSLSPAAVERTAGVLREYRSEMDRLGVGPVRASATSAVRDASNPDLFLDAAEEALGARPELLSGEEEGRLSYMGATAELDPVAGACLVVDIGGGSTELVVGQSPVGGPPTDDGPVGAVSVGAVSVDVGCVRVTERFLLHDPPSREELDRARRFVKAELAAGLGALSLGSGVGTLVALAGTVTTLAAMKLGLESYDRDRVHHSVLSRSDVGTLLEVMSGEDRAGRLRRPGLEAARADVIVGGALILVTVMAITGAESCLVSESDILDGMVMSLLGDDRVATR